MSESLKKQIVQRIGRNLADIMILRLIRTQPMWGYKIIQNMKTNFGIKLGHGVLYPLLNTLEKGGFLQSTQEKHGGRIRKIYNITSKGIQLIDTYHEYLKEQIAMRDIQESEEK